MCNSCPRGDSGPREPGLGAREDGATGKEGRQKARHGESTDMVLTSVLLERTCEASGCDSDQKPAPGGSWGVLRGPEGTRGSHTAPSPAPPWPPVRPAPRQVRAARRPFRRPSLSIAHSCAPPPRQPQGSSELGVWRVCLSGAGLKS